MNIWLNIAAFQVGWFACVVGAAHDMPWAGTAVALAVVAIHLYLAPQARVQARLIAFAAVFGFLADTVLIRGGWLEFSSGILVPDTAPHWIVALWMIFATTLNVSLTWLKNRWLLAVVFGAAGGPLAYYAGSELGAVTLIDPVSALFAVGVAWALAMPLLLLVSERLNGTLTPKKIPEAVDYV